MLATKKIGEDCIALNQRWHYTDVNRSFINLVVQSKFINLVYQPSFVSNLYIATQFRVVQVDSFVMDRQSSIRGQQIQLH
jgi:hypothetical protein